MNEVNFATLFEGDMSLVQYLPLLLINHSTNKNIVWATDTYASFGTYYTKKRQMFPYYNIRLIHDGVLVPRVYKSKEQQHSRTRDRAEVFTPSWLCNKMNNYCDEDWFNRNGVFNTELDNEDGSFSWEVNLSFVSFKNKFDWQKYVNSKRIEITCGEAPYIVSRYDTTSGKIIPVRDRIGMLDRKLRVVSENTITESNWYKWVQKAYKSVYGFEYQGDNLFIARVNLVQTFIDYYVDKFEKQPANHMIKKIVEIVSWNFWQMDGITDTVPFGIPANTVEYVLRDYQGNNEIIYAKIKDWDTNKVIDYSLLKKVKSMKFTYCIGNPPYQISRESTKDMPVYHNFMTEAYKISDKVELITPARFLFNAGATPKFWNKDRLDDKHFKVLNYEADSSKVFINTDIRGGGSYIL